MISSENEKCLLKYLANDVLIQDANNNLYNVLSKFGIKLQFVDSSPIYQIIDELEFFGLPNSFI